MTLDQQYSYLRQRVDRALAEVDALASHGADTTRARYESSMLLALLETVHEARYEAAQLAATRALGPRDL